MCFLGENNNASDISGLIDDRLLRHLASEMGEEWRKLARCLNVRRVRLQAILRNNVNNEQENAIYDMLLTWAKKVPHSCNKVGLEEKYKQ